MLDPEQDLTKINPFDWESLNDSIIPLEPLTPEHKLDSIFNWNKIISVLKNPLQVKNSPLKGSKRV